MQMQSRALRAADVHDAEEYLIDVETHAGGVASKLALVSFYI